AISSASASALVRDRIANVRLGMTIKVAAASGAVIGSVIALFVQSDALTLSFAFVMIYSAVYMFLRPERRVPDDEAEGEDVFVYHDHRTEKDVRYRVRNIRTGMVGFLVGGIISPLSGVGGGAINVPIMNVHMNIPMKVATATSSLIIGITAFMGAVVYLLNGVLDVQTASVVVIGAFAGSELGIRILPKIDTASLRRYFSVVLVFLAMVMFLKVGGVL
ncbi:MAG: sulfite exporter TauE/SafE family protein, partial [Methanomassiliicoccaceae archaeon]|nr:sulfite exporter TauE/SafE family protein [Methanomassiliicoccaceae archaeon]